MNTVSILGVPVSSRSFRQTMDCLLSFVRGSQQHMIVTANPEIVLHAHRYIAYRHILQRASLVVPDGVGLRWAAWLLERSRRWKRPRRARLFLTGFFGLLRLVIFPWSLRQIPERVCGVDLVQALAEESMRQGFSLFFLGARDGVAAALQKFFERQYPGVHIAGVYSGSPAPSEARHICSLIRAAAPDVLFVAYGAPDQEVWLSQHLSSLPSVKIGMGVGGSFDFLTHRQKRAPRLFRMLSLEWLYRLARQPARFRRIVRAVVLFPRAIMDDIFQRH